MDGIDAPSEAIGYLRGSMEAMEGRMAQLENSVNIRFAGLETAIANQNKVLDRLLAIANTGKGAWFAVLKVGGAIAAIVGFLIWVINLFLHSFR